MLLTRIVWSFVWRKFSSVGKGEWWDEIKYGQKLKLGDDHVTPRNNQEVQVSKLWDARGIPFFINKISGHILRHYIFIASYAMCYSWSISSFCFQFSFCFVCFSKWLDHTTFVWRETRSIFIAKNTLVFTLFVQWVFSFSSTAFSFHFLPWFFFRSCYFFVSRYI
jgi:hypothetical protein